MLHDIFINQAMETHRNFAKGINFLLNGIFKGTEEKYLQILTGQANYW